MPNRELDRWGGFLNGRRGAWKLVRFVGLLRLFRRWSLAANARLGIIDTPGVLTERQRRVIEGRTNASERAGPPMIF